MFSVIMPAYKMGQYIGEALESVATQTCQDWEVIVVDDCAPDDGTHNIVKDFASRHKNHRIEFIRHEINTGVSGARNTAIDAAKGEYLAFLDPDDLWLPGYLEGVKKQFEAEPDCDAVSSPPIAIWEVTEFTNFRPDVVNFENWQMLQFPMSLSTGNFLQPSSTVVRKTRVVEIGGFDTDRNMQHIEDYDLWIRLSKAGTKFSFINKNLSKYRKHPGAATSNALRMDELHEYLASKHTSFFINAQRHMMWVIMRDVRAIRRSIKSPIRALISKIFNR